MKGKIAFEEHMAVEETLAQTKAFAGESDVWEDFSRQIMDVGNERLENMEKHGVDYTILSLNAPGVQAILDTREAIRVARKGNDKMAEAVRRHPKHFGAFAALPMQDPDAAAAELVRCVRDLGFFGAMVNGFTQKDVPDSALYYDFPEYRSFWATVSELGVPVYIHPRMQIPTRAQNYEGHRWMMSAPWGFSVETSIHALRLCGSGLFEEFPNLRVMIGHMGETIPFGLGRMEARLRFSPRGYEGKRLPSDYFRDHFTITTSGNFNDAAFRCAIDVLGLDKVCFSADYPFENMADGCNWFDGTDVVSGADKEQVGRGNAVRLFGLEDILAGK